MPVRFHVMLNLIVPVMLAVTTYSATPEVHCSGSLRQIMHEGDLQSQISLTELQVIPHLFALGAVGGLKGEIIILDGKAFVSSVSNGGIVTDSSFSAGAALLVWSQVAHWKNIKIPATIKTLQQLEEFIETQAIIAKIDTSKAFAFRLTGSVGTLDWHVIDWPEGDTVHTHEKHEQSGLHGRLRNAEVEILGFYSHHHQGIFTHMSGNMHLHVVSNDHRLSAHVDSLELSPSMTLLLPR